MNISIFSCPRNGSTYISDSIKRVLKADNLDFAWQGEFFNVKQYDSQTIDLESRIREYIELNTNSNNNIFKIMSSQLPKDGYLEILDRLIHTSNSTNVFLYRSDTVDSVMSYLISRDSGIWENREHHNRGLNSITDYNCDKEKMKMIIKRYVSEVQKNLLAFDKFDFDYVIKYEELNGNPGIDFNSYVTSDYKFKGVSTKLTTKEHKYSILPVEEVLNTIETTCSKLNVPLYLDIPTTGLSNLNFLSKK